MDLWISGGEAKVPDAVKAVVQYAQSHPQEILVLIQELFAMRWIQNPFLADPERGERASLYEQASDLIRNHGDDHIISMSSRSNEFRNQALFALLRLMGFTIEKVQTEEL